MSPEALSLPSPTALRCSTHGTQHHRLVAVPGHGRLTEPCGAWRGRAGLAVPPGLPHKPRASQEESLAWKPLPPAAPAFLLWHFSTRQNAAGEGDELALPGGAWSPAAGPARAGAARTVLPRGAIPGEEGARPGPVTL